MLQEKELPELNKVIEEQRETGPKEGFDKNLFPEDKVIDLGVLGKNKKRPHEQGGREKEDPKKPKLDDD